LGALSHPLRLRDATMTTRIEALLVGLLLVGLGLALSL
jgi:hypothetical protein